MGEVGVQVVHSHVEALEAFSNGSLDKSLPTKGNNVKV